MAYRIAIRPDRVVHRNGEIQSFSERWTELAAMAGVEVRHVDVFSPRLFEDLKGCDGFMWRFDYSAMPRLFAKRLLPAIEHGAKIPVFPSWKTVWHFEDKIAQAYLLQAAGIPQPDTWVFWTRESALDFCERAQYPLVMKLSFGYQSSNVELLQTREDARFRIAQMFSSGLMSLDSQRPKTRLDKAVRRVRAASERLLDRFPDMRRSELQHGYLYLQEFLPGNEFDTRVTVIGDRAFAFRRFNRPEDFRASGSGRIDWDPAQIDIESVRLAFKVAKHLGTQSLGVDVLRRGQERVLNEISYTYASWAVRDCPGRWVLSGDAENGQMTWVEGRMRPEDAIFEDFLALIQSQRTAQATPQLSS